MRTLALLCLILPSLVLADTVVDKYVDQKVDHFASDSKTFKQHIQILKGDDVPMDAPIMFFLGGEFGQDASILQGRQAQYSFGRKMIFVQADHRGYGSYSDDADQTIPLYVTTDQAVEDFHYTIQYLRAQGFTGPIILTGYSYSGGLVVKMISKYPGDATVAIASSPLLHGVLSFDGHDRVIQTWPNGLHDRMAQRIADLQPAAYGDQNYIDRLFLQTALIGVAQYKKFAGFIGKFAAMNAMSTPDFIKALRIADHQNAGDLMALWSNGQMQETLSLDEAKSGLYHSHFWLWQQCNEVGYFYSSNGPTKIFPESDSDLLAICQKRFGRTPTLTNNYRLLLPGLKTHTIIMKALLDAWDPVGDDESEAAPNVEVITVADGQHGPDRDSLDVAKQMMDAAFNQIDCADRLKRQ